MTVVRLRARRSRALLATTAFAPGALSLDLVLWAEGVADWNGLSLADLERRVGEEGAWEPIVEEDETDGTTV